MVFGPWQFGGALYFVLIPSPSQQGPPVCSSASFGAVDVWRSADNGQTWATVDHAGAPSACIIQACFDGAHTITVALQPGTRYGSAPRNFTLVAFDLAAGLWGEVSVPSPEASAGIFGVFPQSGGSVLAVYADSTNTLIRACSYLGGWGLSFEVDSNAIAAIPGGTPVSDNLFGTVDSLGAAHLFFDLYDTTGGNHYLFYQAVSPGDTLGSFSLLGLIGTPNVSESYGLPAVVGTQLVLPVSTLVSGNGMPGVWVGDSLTAPSWTLYENIDPAATPRTDTNYTPPSAAVVGGQLLIASVTPTADYAYTLGVIRLSATADFSGWAFTSQTAFDIETDATPDFQLAGQQEMYAPSLVTLGLALTAFDPTNTWPERFWFALPVVPPPPPSPFAFTLRGVKLRGVS